MLMNVSVRLLKVLAVGARMIRAALDVKVSISSSSATTIFGAVNGNVC